MIAKAFIDTNILAYAVDSRQPDKRLQAQRILASTDFVLSVQVLGELYVTLTRKFAGAVSPREASEVIANLQVHETIPLTGDLVRAAIVTSQRYQLSYWDALIIESAAAANCSVLLTEDLTDGQVISGVRIENPFAHPDRSA